MQQHFSFDQSDEAVEDLPRGAVYTRPWVVELILDLVGYLPECNLVDALAVEPAVGEGAFLIPMVRRLVASCERQERAVTDCINSVFAYEIDNQSFQLTKTKVIATLEELGIDPGTSNQLAEHWIRIGDYLRVVPHLPPADFIVGNPPYIRLEEIPSTTLKNYREAYPTMRGRADLYIGFFEAALRQLKHRGVCAYICADRWMLNQYGANLRKLITSAFNLETVIEMHDADTFDSNVSAYPAITVIRREQQGRVVVARATSSLSSVNTARMKDYLRPRRDNGSMESPSAALSSAVVDRWFDGSEPWPCRSPRRLATLRYLEERFVTLEDSNQTKIGIGVATGCDDIFIVKDDQIVETSRLLPLAMAVDTLSGTLCWSGSYLVDPWNATGLVSLEKYPQLRAYFEKHKERLKKRHTAEKNPHGWYRTIDRITHSLTTKRKLLIPDIKNVFNPVIDEGTTYPHHNLYYIQSECWDLEVLGGILLSAVGQFFIEAYGVRMRGGYLRFQAQYLRRIRVPNPENISEVQANELISAFRERNRDRATEVALKIYNVAHTAFD